ncbi:MAG: hypothetical protein JNM63_00750 [Spirochaetia bacterium]|nr:hypothetical protein [Spirochaetia bacterium]
MFSKAVIFAILVLNVIFAAGPSNELDFAKWLYGQGQYYAAFNSYERAIYFSDRLDDKKTAAKGALNSLLRGVRANEVFQVLPTFKALDLPDVEYQQSLNLFEARARIHRKEYSNAYTQARFVLESPRPSSVSNSSKPLPGSSIQREALLVMASTVVNASPLTKINTSLSSIRLPESESDGSSFRLAWKDHLASIPQKPRLALTSPLLSGLFGAVLPGLGHLYNERPLDALQNFLINSVLISLSVFLLRDDIVNPGKEGRFLLSAPVTAAAGVFYLVNLYSSVNVSLRRNEKLEAGFRLGIQKNLESLALRFQVEW